VRPRRDDTADESVELAVQGARGRRRASEAAEGKEKDVEEGDREREEKDSSQATMFRLGGLEELSLRRLRGRHDFGVLLLNQPRTEAIRCAPSRFAHTSLRRGTAATGRRRRRVGRRRVVVDVHRRRSVFFLCISLFTS